MTSLCIYPHSPADGTLLAIYRLEPYHDRLRGELVEVGVNAWPGASTRATAAALPAHETSD